MDPAQTPEVQFLKFNWSSDIAQILGPESSQMNVYQTAAVFGIDLFEPPLASSPSGIATRKRRKKERKTRQERKAKRARLNENANRSTTSGSQTPSKSQRIVIDLTEDDTIDLTAYASEDEEASPPARNASIATAEGSQKASPSNSASTSSSHKGKARAVEVDDFENEANEEDENPAEQVCFREAGLLFTRSHCSEGSGWQF
ncbi:hypothetical protein VNI00_019172 [Paramarasmius palmivorus]|uniref:Uncharacterized protein n=1 Tax=Paramarasmius palmivorus TaxID=297713 RepID=A0AAW0AQX8_9AGAR